MSGHRTVILMFAVLPLMGGTLLTSGGADVVEPRLELIATWKAPSGRGTETLSVQSATRRVALANSCQRIIHVLDLSVPDAPMLLLDIAVPGAAGDELTSVAFHPTEDWVFAVVSREDPRATGWLYVFGSTDGRRLADVAVGVDPDAVVVDPEGRTAVVANEAQGYWREGGRLHSMPGTVSVVDLRRGLDALVVKTLELRVPPDATGFVAPAHRRALERAIDLNGDGVIEGEDEEKVQVDVDLTASEHLEPEYVSFSPDGRSAWVTLQENNGLVEIDPLAGRVLRYMGLGTTLHAADVDEDGVVSFATDLLALREPDSVAVTVDGRFVLTADEGDTEPKASKSSRALPSGGGRTVTVLDAITGHVLGDTGGQLDVCAAAEGLYPEDRSDSKGSEPEGVVALEWRGRPFAVVGLERAGALALIDLADPTKPRVAQMAALGAGSIAPEVVGVLESTCGRTFVLSANEVSGDLAVFELR